MSSNPSTRRSEVTTEEFKCFLNLEPLLYVYKEIAADDKERHPVHNFYSNFLWLIFPVRSSFSTGLLHSRVPHTITKESCSTGEFPMLLSTRYFISMELEFDTRLVTSINASFENGVQDWESALRQATDFAISERNVQIAPSNDVFIIVTFGTELRFHWLALDQEEAIDWPAASGRVYELADDEETIWHLLLQLRDEMMAEPPSSHLGPDDLNSSAV